MTDCILVNPPMYFTESGDVELTKGYTLYPPLGILYIGAAMQQAGLEIGIIDALAGGRSISYILAELERQQAPLVGISATTPQIRGAVVLAESIKERFGDSVIVGLGGPHASADPDFVGRFACFDFGFTGEGEQTFPELVKRVLAGERPEGICAGVPAPELDSIPFPARHLVNAGDYYLAPYESRFATVHTIRGCPFNCSFCSNPVGGRQIRFRSPKNVVDEIEQCIHDFGIEYVLFTDDTFTIRKEHAAEICEDMMRRGIKLTWSCETRANLVDRELLELMREAGCHEVSFGVESGNEHIRKEMLSKNISNEDLLKAFGLCRELGIEANAFCMLGIPGETREYMLETLRFVKQLKPDIMGLHQTVLFPGSPLYRQAMAEGKIAEDTWERYARGEINEQPIYLPGSFTQPELDAVQKHIYTRYYWRPAYLWRRFVKDISSLSRLRQDLKMGIGLLFSAKTKTGRP